MKYTCAHCTKRGDTYNGVRQKYCSTQCQHAAMTRVEKVSLIKMLSLGWSLTQIAAKFHVDRSTITRAIKRYGLVT